MLAARPTLIRLRALIVALLVIAAGCGGDDDDSAATTTSGSTPSSSSSSSTTSSSAGTPACGSDPITADGAPASTAEADVDGDGQVDELSTFVNAGTSMWRLQVAFGAGGSSGADVAPVAAGEVAALGGTDVDGKRGEEIWATVGSGASATIIGLFRLDGCDVGAVELAGGPAEFAVGASVRNTSGLECRERAGGGADLLAYDGSSEDGQRYAIEVIEYRLSGAQLTLQGRSERTARADGPDFARYTSFSCDDVSV